MPRSKHDLATRLAEAAERLGGDPDWLGWLAADLSLVPKHARRRELLARASTLAIFPQLLETVVQPRFAPLFTQIIYQLFQEAKRAPLTQEEVAWFVDQYMEAGIELADARQIMVDALYKSMDAVEKAHQRYGKHKGERGRRRRNNDKQ